MAGTLQVLEHHDAHEVAYVETVSRGVDTQVGSSHFLVELIFSARHD